MSQITLNAFNTALTESLFDSIAAGESNYYYFVGKPLPWPDADTTIATPIDTIPYLNSVRKDMVLLKKVQASNCVFMATKTDWTTTTVYDAYDDTYGKTVTYAITGESGAVINGTFDLSEFEQGWLVEGTNIPSGTTVLSATTSAITLSQSTTGSVTSVDITKVATSEAATLGEAIFYVITSSDKVYKCLNNNLGAQSVNEPTGTSDTPFETADGYVWRYMFTAPTSFMDTFGTTTEIPLLPASGFSPTPLGIFSILVSHGGDNYSATPVVTITGDGSDATAEAVVVDDKITEINMLSYGTGYTYATVTITDGTGSGAAARAVIAPTGGHASNPAREFASTALRLSVEVVEGDLNQAFEVDNQYRQSGIIKDPLDYLNTGKITASLATPCLVLEGDFAYASVVEDEIITDILGNEFLVVAKPQSDPGAVVTLLVQSLDSATPEVGDIITYDATNATLSDVTLPDVDKYSGMIINIDNRANYVTDSSNTISFKTTIRF